MVVGIAAVAFTGFLLMLVILKFGGNSKFGIKGKTLLLHQLLSSCGGNLTLISFVGNLVFTEV